MEFKEPPKPENITVKPVIDPRTDRNYTMSVQEEACLFWDSIEERWLSRGCRVRKSLEKILLFLSTLGQENAQVTSTYYTRRRLTRFT